MRCVAICYDVEGGADRSALFQAHLEHNLARMGAFLLTGPIANADGATGIGDDPRLIGSLYCLEVDDLAAARSLMESDPFMHGAWARIDYYDWSAAGGVWEDWSTRPKGLSSDHRCYVAASIAHQDLKGALMCGAVDYLASTAAPAAPLRSLAVLRADTMEGARRLAPNASWIAALPIAIGRWVGISSPADLPAPP